MTQIDILTYSSIILRLFTVFTVYYFLVLIFNFLCFLFIKLSLFLYKSLKILTKNYLNKLEVFRNRWLFFTNHKEDNIAILYFLFWNVFNNIYRFKFWLFTILHIYLTTSFKFCLVNHWHMLKYTRFFLSNVINRLDSIAKMLFSCFMGVYMIFKILKKNKMFFTIFIIFFITFDKKIVIKNKKELLNSIRDESILYFVKDLILKVGSLQKLNKLAFDTLYQAKESLQKKNATVYFIKGRIQLLELCISSITEILEGIDSDLNEVFNNFDIVSSFKHISDKHIATIVDSIKNALSTYNNSLETLNREIEIGSNQNLIKELTEKTDIYLELYNVQIEIKINMLKEYEWINRDYNRFSEFIKLFKYNPTFCTDSFLILLLEYKVSILELKTWCITKNDSALS